MIAKGSYWSAIDGARPRSSIESATGLGRYGAVRPLDPPHTQANFVMREMGFEVARRHAARLRRMAVLLLFVVPALAMLLILLLGDVPLVLVLSLAAVVSAAAGVLIERWLFFAEARHVSMLYYGADPT